MRVNTLACAVAACALVALSVTSAHATETQIDISSLTNTSVADLTNGGSYPAGGSTIAIGGVNFNLASDMAGYAQIIQTGTGDPNFFPQSPGPYTINVGIAGVHTAYAIVNSAFGFAGVDTGSLTFQGADPLHTLTVHLIEGVNIRDHYTDGSFNQIANVFATANYNTPGSMLADVRFDVLAFDLSSFGSDTLNTITFNGNAAAGGGMPFLAAVTIDTGVPEPSAWALMLTGFGGAGYALRKRRGAFKTA